MFGYSKTPGTLKELEKFLDNLPLKPTYVIADNTIAIVGGKKLDLLAAALGVIDNLFKNEGHDFQLAIKSQFNKILENEKFSDPLWTPTGKKKKATSTKK